MKKYRLLITEHGLFYAMSHHKSYELAVKALPNPSKMPREWIHTHYEMEIIRTDTWQIVDRGWCNPPIWGWVLGGIEQGHDTNS